MIRNTDIISSGNQNKMVGCNVASTGLPAVPELDPVLPLLQDCVEISEAYFKSSWQEYTQQYLLMPPDQQRSRRMELGRRLVELRNESGLAFAELSQKSGIAQASLVAVELGLAYPTLELSDHVAKALQIPIERWFSREWKIKQLLEEQSKKYAEKLATEERAQNPYIRERLRNMREKAGLTIAELSKQAGVNESNLAGIESGKKSLSLSLADRLSRVLGVSREAWFDLDRRCPKPRIIGSFVKKQFYIIRRFSERKRQLYLSEVGQRLKDSMAEKEWTQLELGQIANVSDGVISCIVNGKGYPREETLQKLTQALDISIVWLLTGKISHASDRKG